MMHGYIISNFYQITKNARLAQGKTGGLDYLDSRVRNATNARRRKELSNDGCDTAEQAQPSSRSDQHVVGLSWWQYCSRGSPPNMSKHCSVESKM